MRQTMIILGLTVAGMLIVVNSRAEEYQNPSEAYEAHQRAHQQDVEEIRQVVTDVVKAYNVKDAKTLVSLFTKDVEFSNAKGRWFQLPGQKNLEKFFSDLLFKENPQSKKIDATVGSVRFVSPGVAIEDGTATAFKGPGAEKIRYAAVLVNVDGKWRIASLRELETLPE